MMKCNSEECPLGFSQRVAYFYLGMFHEIQYKKYKKIERRKKWLSMFGILGKGKIKNSKRF